MGWNGRSNINISQRMPTTVNTNGPGRRGCPRSIANTNYSVGAIPIACCPSTYAQNTRASVSIIDCIFWMQQTADKQKCLPAVFMLCSSALPLFSEVRRGMLSALRAPVERLGVGSPTQPESVSNRLASNDHLLNADAPACKQLAMILKRSVLRNIPQSVRQ